MPALAQRSAALPALSVAVARLPLPDGRTQASAAPRRIPPLALEASRRGIELARQGRLHAALIPLEHAARLAPTVSAHHLQLARVLRGLRRHEAAVAAARRAQALAPGDSATCELLAEMLGESPLPAPSRPPASA